MSWAVWQKITLRLSGVASLFCPLANIINISRSGEIDFPFYSFGSLTGCACQGRVRVTVALCYELVYQLMSLFGHNNPNVFSPSPAGSLFQFSVKRINQEPAANLFPFNIYRLELIVQLLLLCLPWEMQNTLFLLSSPCLVPAVN